MLWRITQGVLFHFRVIAGRLLARPSHNPGDFAVNWIRDICRPSLWRRRELHVERLRSTDGVTSYIPAATPEMTVLSHPTTYPIQTIKQLQITQQLHHWLPCAPTWWDTAVNSPSLAAVYHWLCPTQRLPLLEGSLKEDVEINISIGKSLEILTGVSHI